MLRTIAALVSLAFFLVAGSAAGKPRNDSAFCADQHVTEVAMWTCVKPNPAALHFQLVMTGGGLAITWVLWCEGYQPFTHTVVAQKAVLDIKVGPNDYRKLYSQMLASRICRLSMLIQGRSSSSAPHLLTVAPHWLSR